MSTFLLVAWKMHGSFQETHPAPPHPPRSPRLGVHQYQGLQSPLWAGSEEVREQIFLEGGVAPTKVSPRPIFRQRVNSFVRVRLVHSYSGAPSIFDSRASTTSVLATLRRKGPLLLHWSQFTILLTVRTLSKYS